MSYGNSEFVIHPGQTRMIERLEVDIVFDRSKQIIEVIGGQPIASASMSIRYEIFAQGMRKKTGEVAFQTADFREVKWEGT